MAEHQHICLQDVAQRFDALEDPRSHINRLHPLGSVIVIAIMAILAGADGATAIARWARIHHDFLRRSLHLPNGTPCKDVFRIVLCRLDPDIFQACFSHWLESLRIEKLNELGISRPIYNVDGKTHRRSHDHAKGLGALHSVSIWASEVGMTLAQVACAEKSNEITAIPEVLAKVDIAGTIITIDAMGTQKAIANQIIEQGADYLLALKGNHEKLHDAVINHIDEHMESDFVNVGGKRHIESEKSHGREETRTYTQIPAPKELPGFDEWTGLETIGMVTRCYVEDGREYSDVRYFLCSLAMDVKEFARAARKHWGIENGCHWTLDMTFREDESRIRGERIRENMAWLNRFGLSLLKQHPRKDSVAMKRRMCGWDPNFLLEVLTGYRS